MAENHGCGPFCGRKKKKREKKARSVKVFFYSVGDGFSCFSRRAEVANVKMDSVCVPLATVSLCLSDLCPIYVPSVSDLVRSMSNLCPIYVRPMSNLCPTYVRSVSDLHPICVRPMSDRCPIYVRCVSDLCPTYVRSVSDLCLTCVRSMSDICPICVRSVSDLCPICVRSKFCLSYRPCSRKAAVKV